MIKLQRRIERVAAVAEEYRAAQSAAALLGGRIRADPDYGRRNGWRQRAGEDFEDNLTGTYLIRMYAEFEAALRDYWKTHLNKGTHPKMAQLVNASIPNQRFPQDVIDNADDVRKYRNSLVHDIEDEPPPGTVVFTVQEAKRHLCSYVACFDANWK